MQVSIPKNKKVNQLFKYAQEEVSWMLMQCGRGAKAAAMQMKGHCRDNYDRFLLLDIVHNLKFNFGVMICGPNLFSSYNASTHAYARCCLHTQILMQTITHTLTGPSSTMYQWSVQSMSWMGMMSKPCV
jgi:hypothetical protein